MAGYRDRFYKVIEFIDEHLNESLSTTQLSEVAHLSRYHFHRQFQALFGVNVSQLIHLIRLKRAATTLEFRETPITDIAFQAGYDSAEAFTRGFKRVFGMSPSEFRKSPDWSLWQRKYDPVLQLRRDIMKANQANFHVEVIEFKPINAAMFVHDPEKSNISDDLKRLIGWRRENGLPPSKSRTFNIWLDSDQWESEDCRNPNMQKLGLAVELIRDVPLLEDMIETEIPGGRVAKLRINGHDDQLEPAIRFLYANWLEQSSKTLRDFPFYLERVKFFPEVPEHEAILDLFLPLN